MKSPVHLLDWRAYACSKLLGWYASLCFADYKLAGIHLTRALYMDQNNDVQITSPAMQYLPAKQKQQAQIAVPELKIQTK
eukprot:711001-Pelagomonas_calceolata.AAC.1